MATTRAEKRIARVIRHRYMLAHTYCEVRAIGCHSLSAHAHHRKRRSQGGTDEPDNLLAVCASCHDRIHAFPEWAYANGWLVHSWDVL